MSSKVWIYHERQDSLLCGQHALNNLIQQENFFHAGMLADIAQQLDSEEHIFMGGGSVDYNRASGNVDAQGNFSIQVITNALTNIGIDLTVWNIRRAETDPSLEIGFIVNRNAHWFAIRKINGNWWDLNSAKDKPELISAFYLGAFLSQLASDGYSVFVAKGNYIQTQNSSTARSGTFWHLESSLMKGKQPSTTVEKFVGQGHRVGFSEGPTQSGILNRNEDEDLKIAIALSLAEVSPTTDLTQNKTSEELTEKEKIRAKRLAAMANR